MSTSSLQTELRNTAEHVFNEFPSGKELRLLSVEASGEALFIRFEGEEGDERGPFAARIPLPHQINDDLWRAYTESESLTEWITYGALVRVRETYDTTMNLQRPHCPDGTWWLDLY